ncbi:MAG: transcription-repair coupling factor [Deltaproteobacteria bacterium]|nr:transcription-repair coupling factor [Deltaproteobacteria bacterium]
MSAESAFTTLLERVKLGQPHTEVIGLFGLATAHAVWKLAQIRPVVFVCRSGQLDDVLRDLRFMAGPARAHRVLALPADERTPYHASSPDPVVVMERVATVHKLCTGGVDGGGFDVVVVPPESLCRKGLPFAEVQRMAEVIEKEQELDRAATVKKLIVGGYSQVSTVEDAGTFALRGSILDVFFAGADKPVRVDLFGDVVESIKSFDPQSQRTLGFKETVSIGPAREVHLDDTTIPRATKRLRELADEVEYPTKKLRELLADLDNRISFFGIEGLLPAFYEALESPLALVERALGKNQFTVVLDEPDAITGAVAVVDADFEEHRRQALVRGDLCFPISAFLETGEAALQRARACRHVELLSLVVEGRGANAIEIQTKATADVRGDILKESARPDGDAHSLLTPLVKRMLEWRSRKRTILMPVHSLGGVERWRELLKAHHLEIRQLPEGPNGALDLLDDDAIARLRDPSVHAWTWIARPADPAHGAELPHVGPAGVVVVAEEEVFGRRARRSVAARKGGFKTTLGDLKEGDFVVHVEHGVATFQGLTRLNLRGIEQDYLLLIYDGGDKLYLPVHRINLVQKYVGPGGQPPRVDKLGGAGWESTRRKVKAAVVAMAQDLLALYAKRELTKRVAHPEPDESYWEFEAAFQFEPTPDQQKAIDDVLSDMRRERPMDRLICGDVGYGKTEVGMRAAMLTITGRRQVAVLAPTTVLAQQHFQTFTERFKATGAIVEVVSRFKSNAEIKDILKRTKEGKVDILIGTHRLLSADVAFPDLGLIMVDEEQRFGVKNKEAIKRWKANVDVLTLTATPIPRTLQMGFFGIRDMSVIETPPADRRAIRTSICKFDDDLIREAMLRELSRGGQVYFVHNRVRSIQATADYLKRLVPEARCGIGHGQMTEDELEDVMLRFMKHELNVLVCTAIIETGIDVSSANTMFIDHAEDFGLAQLYQLRGRVGRSKERAFAFLLIPGGTEHLHPDARARLEILQRFSDLGAGFQVAQHDLELRGAGDLLGKNQHGHVAAVGYDLYAELLRDAVEQLRGGSAADLDVPDPEITLPVAAFIPDKYIPDMHERLQTYQRMASAKDGAEIYDVVGGLNDLYGDVPPEVSTLADVMVLKLKLRDMAARGMELVLPPSGAQKAPQHGPSTLTESQQKQAIVNARRAGMKVRGPAEQERKLKLLDGGVPKVVITLGDRAKLDPARLLLWVNANNDTVKLTPQMKLVVTPTDKEWRTLGEDPIALCRETLRKVAEAALGKPRG